MMNKIGFIGTGKMADAIIAAILRSKQVAQQDILCYDILEESLETISQKYGVQVADNHRQVFRESDIIFLAFKPQNFPFAIEDAADAVREDHIIVSIMAGVRIQKIQKFLPAKVIRVMPNTACLVGEMAAGFARAENVTPEEALSVKHLLESAGVALEVEEEQLDAVTALSGSGPAFVARLIEAFIDAGEAAGLDQQVSRDLTLKTFLGTAKLLADWHMEPDELVQRVSSPGGTTVAGRKILESCDLPAVIKRTVLRAAERSRELGSA